ncbi:MAG: mycofactocin-coupled SDR family oxidoreductase [Beutenbergiaceae bacterium]
MAGRVEGKVAFITGAARGQGRAHAVRLAEEGADIIALDICAPVPDNLGDPATEEDLAETVRQVEALDRRIHAAVGDVRNGEQVRTIVADGVAALGRLDIVAANAGIAGIPKPGADMSDEEFVNMIDINLIGVWRTAQAAIPHIRAGGQGGSIIMTSSVAGLKPTLNLAHYVAAKHGVVGLMRTLALELASDSIRVNSIHPTTVDTAMVQNDTIYRLFMPHLENPTKDDFREAALAMNALPVPWVEAVDIANALLFLASEESRYITGVALPVDAGITYK